MLIRYREPTPPAPPRGRRPHPPPPERAALPPPDRPRRRGRAVSSPADGPPPVHAPLGPVARTVLGGRGTVGAELLGARFRRLASTARPIRTGSCGALF